jgi:antitoxin component YwqK of YwqJK toxin-antitoxin module
MTVINARKHSKLICALLLLPLISYSQEVPCREWYYTTDRNGNQIKGRCKDAWQVNSDGQIHGKGINYYENGNPEFVVSYSNGVRNGSFRKFKEDGVTILVQGNFLNGVKVGKWKWTDEIGFLTLDYDHNEQLAYHWKNLILKSDAQNAISGDLLFWFRFGVISGQPQTGTITVSVNGNENYHQILTHIPSKGWTVTEDIMQRDENIHRDIYEFTLQQDVINEIIQKLKRSGSTPKDGFAILHFSEGKFAPNTPYKLYDVTGGLMN